jgi:CspA family cold shock protein
MARIADFLAFRDYIDATIAMRRPRTYTHRTWFLRPCQTKRFCLLSRPSAPDEPENFPSSYSWPRPPTHVARAQPPWFKGNQMTIGTVKFFNASKGFGFISPEGGGKDVFVHVSAVEAAGMRTLSEGQKVNFDIQPDARGSKASNLSAA